MKKFMIIVRDFYREHEPYTIVISADSKQNACYYAMNDDNVKEVLDIKEGIIELAEEEINQYWLMYYNQKGIDWLKSR